MKAVVHEVYVARRIFSLGLDDSSSDVANTWEWHSNMVETQSLYGHCGLSSHSTRI